ncbi:MAG: ABC transporter ATP-binding protein [Candidatus Bathyarchaeia archaeon]
MTAPFLNTEDLSVCYGSIAALAAVSLEVHKGEALALVGPSGSGKTTLLRVLAGLQSPTSGAVFVEGRREDAAGLRQIASMVFQRTVMFNTSVYENVAFGLRVKRIREEQAREEVSEALEKVGLRGFEKRKARRLSGGEQQRVSIARALAVKPAVLLLDEPTANLDPANASLIERIILGLRADGQTVVLATHRLDQAERLADRVAILNGGRLVQVGDARGLFRRPSGFLASFGQLRNVFQGAATLSKEGLAAITLEGGVRIEAASKRTGRVSVFVRPEDIIVSKAPIVSSARNVLRGRIVKVEERNGLVELTVDVGQQLTAVVTRQSFAEMGLNLGLEVYLAFKASSVEVI